MVQENLLMKEAVPVRGRMTYVDISRTAPFFLPWERDPWFRLRPPFSTELLRMSLELSAAANDLKINDWMRAGWTDFTFQVDNKLLGGISPAQAGETRQFLYNKWAVYRARSTLRQLNPVSQVLSAMRQRSQSDTGKVLVMIKAGPNGRYVVAIGFKGTGGRFYDWFSNFRFASESGMHQGFLQLARQFEGNAERIEFPETARELGLEKLTLAEIFSEARHHDSRFLLWFSGHSQGAAVMQVFTYLQIQETGVLPENVVGYGFASPTVMMGTTVRDPAAYPVYHVLNSEDYVPRAGAQMHLGVSLVYPAGEEIHRAAYGWRETPEAAHTRDRVWQMTRRMVDMPTIIESGMAYLQALSEKPVGEILEALNLMNLRILPIRQVMAAAGARTEDLLRFARRRVEKAYISLTGHPLDPQLLNALQSEMEAAMRELGAREISKAIGEMVYWPHILMPPDGKSVSSYQYIALKGLRQLHPAIWESGSPPRQLWLEEIVQKPVSQEKRAEAMLSLFNRRRLPATRRPRVRPRLGYSSRRREARR